MAYVNPLIAKWKAGQPTFGAWLTTPDVSIAEYFALCRLRRGDRRPAAQHDRDERPDRRCSPRSSCAASVPSTRVPFNDYVAIGGALDLGAQMVIVPMVNNAEEAIPSPRRSDSAKKRGRSGLAQPPGCGRLVGAS